MIIKPYRNELNLVKFGRWRAALYIKIRAHLCRKQPETATYVYATTHTFYMSPQIDRQIMIFLLLTTAVFKLSDLLACVLVRVPAIFMICRHALRSERQVSFA
jgi:hypothetical protein